MHHHGQHEQVDRGGAPLPLGSIQRQHPLAFGQQGSDGTGPGVGRCRFVVEAAAYLLPVGFRVLVSGHEVGNLVQADLARTQQRDQSARQVRGKGQAERLKLVLDGFDRIGLGHSEALSRECLATSR